MIAPKQGTSRVGTAEVEVKMLLDLLDHDAGREAMTETPRRMVAALMELTTPEEFDFVVFDAKDYDQMIIVDRIPFTSLCEHHVLPFMGFAAVGYIPKKKMAGLSKIVRMVQYYARALQTQEHLTRAISARLLQELEPLGLAVVMQARHLCMELRGARTTALTTTSAIEGALLEVEARAEFFSLIHLAD